LDWPRWRFAPRGEPQFDDGCGLVSRIHARELDFVFEHHSAYVGQETRDGASVIHVSASQPFPNLSGEIASLTQHLTQVDLYLDPTTSLPVSYVFNSHPDNNAGLDIPTEIRYSDYKNVGGVQIPFHVQKFINNTLTLDLQFQNASLNTGITAAQISAQ